MSKASDYAKVAHDYPFKILHGAELRVGRFGGLLVYVGGKEVADIDPADIKQMIEWLRETYED